MTAIADRVREFLEGNGVVYDQIHHQRDFTAMKTAEHTHTPGKQFAKAVVTRVGGEFALAVLPSNHTVDPERFASALEGKEVAIASEDEVDRLFPDCEEGAVPPFGNLYGLQVYVSPALKQAEKITCVAGSHAEAIRLGYRDFERLVRPKEVDFSVVYHGGPPERG